MAQRWYCGSYKILDSREDGQAGCWGDGQDGREASERKGEQGILRGSVLDKAGLKYTV